MRALEAASREERISQPEVMAARDTVRVEEEENAKVEAERALS